MTVSCPNHPEVVEDLSECAACGKSFCPDCIITLNGRTTCAACKSQNLRDIRSGAPELLGQASRGARFVAVILDNLMVFLIAYALFALIVYLQLSSINAVSRGSGTHAHVNVAAIGIILLEELVIFVGLPALYEGLMLANYQATLGKRAMGIKVVSANGSRMTTKQAWGRVGSRYLCGIVPILNIVDPLMIFSANRLCIHDRIADTCVVKKSA